MAVNLSPDGGHLYRCPACGHLFESESRNLDGWRCACVKSEHPKPAWHWSLGLEVAACHNPSDPSAAGCPELAYAGTLAEYLGVGERVMPSPICCEDFCDDCGDCLVCYGEDPCRDGGKHVPSERMREAAR